MKGAPRKREAGEMGMIPTHCLRMVHVKREFVLGVRVLYAFDVVCVCVIHKGVRASDRECLCLFVSACLPACRLCGYASMWACVGEQ